ncbi:azurin [Marilutibacter chinensis]|uniref:Azurin n=1 Tax=Marilutibacter chinensis TaxID=2912247 RepID=A0ABS9HQB2_9GAMM|nr:azurin [Lysobacter chinensis]MCF7221125.1 azurin [Lysobacter chinensis]
MKILSTAILLLGLAAAGQAQAADTCKISLKGDDAMRFDLKEATVSAACPSITVELVHVGKLPAAAMGHNVVIAATGDVDAVNRDGIRTGVARHYVNKDDPRVIAATALVGGGERTTITFPGGKLAAGGDYTFFCSFPGHATLMKGKLTVTR